MKILPASHSIRKMALACLLCAPAIVNASLLVVGNVNPPIKLSKSEVKAIFMGGANSHDLKGVALTPENKARKQFNAKIIGMTESRIQSYWAQMRFSGRLTPPKEVESAEQMLDYLRANEGSVGYLSESTQLPEGLKVVYTTR